MNSKARDKEHLKNKGPRAASLFMFLRRLLERPGARLSMHDLSRAAVVQLLRRENVKRLNTRRKDLEHEAARLSEAVHDPTDSRQLRQFCEYLYESAEVILASQEHANRFDNSANTKAWLEDALAFEKRRGLSDDEAMKRAVTRVIKERKKGDGKRSVRLESNDPLRALLHLETGAQRLPRTDVRVAIVGQRHTPLGQALRDAARFREEVLREALGEELWGLCRPTGFASSRRTKLLVAVLSSAILQEVSMRKSELLSRIKRTEGFENVRSLKLYVSEGQSLPVYGRFR